MPNIERVAIIGAGNMGSGIAQKSSQENFEVEMIDIEKKWVENGPVSYTHLTLPTKA